MSEVFGVEEDDSDSNVVSKHPDHVLRKRQHLRQTSVIDPVCGAAQSTSRKDRIN